MAPRHDLGDDRRDLALEPEVGDRLAGLDDREVDPVRGRAGAAPTARRDDDHDRLVEVVERLDAPPLLDPEARARTRARAVGVDDPRVGLEEDERVLGPAVTPNRRCRLVAREQLARGTALLERLPAS